jgi:hypothetical protein
MLHPITSYELAKLRIKEEHEYAARQRLVKAATSDKHRSIDMARLGEKLRVRVFGGSLFGGRRPAAGAGA